MSVSCTAPRYLGEEQFQSKGGVLGDLIQQGCRLHWPFPEEDGSVNAGAETFSAFPLHIQTMPIESAACGYQHWPSALKIMGSQG